jgi:3-oxoacyl-[acyl-carrier-protein] synthase II
MKAYISSCAAISAQLSFNDPFPWREFKTYIERMPAIEPDYKEFISLVKLRRMNRMVRMGIAVAAKCLQSSMLERPDAIIATTGWGCLEDTYRFLDEIIEKKEEMPSPATFIQSTHNTVGGQIALHFECQEYHNVYVNHTSSFEHGLLDALLLIAEGKENVLIGGIDELTNRDFELKQRSGYWKKIPVENSVLFESKDPGCIPGEGTAFFLLTNKRTAQCSTGVDGVFISSNDNLMDQIKSNTGLAVNDFDLVISGYNGDIRLKSPSQEFLQTNFPKTLHCYYKHLCGEYDTASSFALWLANEIIKTQIIPNYLFIDPLNSKLKEIKRILIHNFIEPDTHACILVSKADL